MTDPPNPNSLKRIDGLLARMKLIQSDLERSEPETESHWHDVARWIVTRRAEEQGAQEDVREFEPELMLGEREKTRVLERLADSWASEWKRFDSKVDRALRHYDEESEKTRTEEKQDVLKTAILEALHEADEKQVTRIGRNRAAGHGSRLVLLQKQDLKEVARKGVTDELIRKLTSRPAGLRVFPSEGILSPIEAVFLLDEVAPDQARPLDLRPSLFLRWLRRRAIKKAEERLLQDAGFDRSDAPDSWREVEARDPETEPDEEPLPRDQVTERELLEALDREDPDPLERLIADEERDQLRTIATETEWEDHEAINKKWSEGVSESEAVKAVAEERGVEVNTIHKNRQRLKERGIEHFSDD